MKKYIVLFLLMSFAFQLVAIDAKDFTKVISESFDVELGAKLHVENKYGAIYVDSWDKSEISIEVTIKVKTGSQSKADKLFDMIDVTIEGDRSGVSAVSSFDNVYNSSSWWDRMFDDHDSGDYEISYQISAPKDIQLDVTNKYGHLHINSDFVGDAELTNKYGNIYAENIKGDVDISLGYGNLKIGDVHDLDMNIKYGKAHVGNGHKVTIDSKYSDLTLGSMDELRSESKYDDYDVQYAASFTNSGKYDDFLFTEIGDCQLSSKYTTLKIANATGKVKVRGGYNELLIKNSTPSMSTVEVVGKYCKVKMRIDHSFSLDFDASYVTPWLPSDFDKVVYVHDGSDIEIRGSKGSAKHTEILAKMDYGSFKIVE